jgi:hypothetical protein
MDAKEKKPQHIEKDMPDSAVHEHIRDKSPDPSAHHQGGYHGQVKRQEPPEFRAEKLRRGKNKDIDSDKPIHRAVVPVPEGLSDNIHDKVRIGVNVKKINLNTAYIPAIDIVLNWPHT